jgi:predicted nucleic acid-binding protein
MKEGRVFVDTNIFVYAYDDSAGKKHNRALEIMEELWITGRGIISTQVLQEFFVAVTRKIPNPVEPGRAKGIVEDYLKWRTVFITGGTILDAIDIHGGYKYSFWDSLIIASAFEGGAKIILSEDFSFRHKIKGIEIRNPFAGRG